MKHPRCVILGGGGHAAVVIDCILAGKLADIVAVLDADSKRWRSEVLGFPIVGNDEELPELIRRGVTHFAVGVGSIGDASLRHRLFDAAVERGLAPLAIRHPSCICSPTATIGEGSQLLPGSIVNARAVVGRNVIVNSGAIVEHDCSIGEHAHIASGAVLAGAVHIGAGAFVGGGAMVRQGLRIGEGAVVGAGSVVVKDVPPGVVVAGVPARAMKQ